MLAPIVTILVVLGTLAVLACNVFATGCFFAAAPRGERAVGMVVPIVIVGAAGLLLVLAGVLVACRAGRASAAVVQAGPVVGGALTVVVTVGVALAAGLAFVLWAEPVGGGAWVAWVKPALGWTAGIIAPVVLAAVLLMDASMSAAWLVAHAKLLSATRAACWLLAVVAVLGYAGGLFTFGQPLRVALVRMTHAGWSKVAGGEGTLPIGVSAAAVLKQELDALPMDTPIANYVHLFIDPNIKGKASCQKLLTQRVTASPTMHAELLAVMRGKPYLHRWGAAEMIRTAPDDVLETHADAWAEAITAGLLATADDMSMRPQWLTEHFDGNPQPLELVRALIAAGERFREPRHARPIAEAMQQLARDADALTRGKAWTKLEKMMQRADYPIVSPEVTR